jgi:hypothetical protein
VPSIRGLAAAGGWRPFLDYHQIAMTDRFDNLPGKARMPFATFCRTFCVTDRERLLLADGLQLDRHGLDPEAGYRLLKQLRR